MQLIRFTLAAAAIAITPAALAQTAPQTSTGTAPTSTAPAQTSPATPTAPAPSTAAVTDAEVDQFATAALEVNKIQADASVSAADKGAKMAAAVTATGLTADRFNAISQAMAADPALNKRIQTAAAAKQGAATPAPSPSM